MDIISGLPDDLLLKILLLLPTKVAVSTSVLSKRWEYLWMWLPKLKYNGFGCSESEAKRLQCFLDRNLPLHRAPVIESFRLVLFFSRLKPENIKMWVLTALSHCLRELEISSYESHPAKPVILPSNLFTCKSLVILKLFCGILLDVPRIVSLPSLKTLKLEYVRYINDEALQWLLSNFPALEDLVVKLAGGNESTRKLTVVVPSLQRLSLDMPCTSVTDGYVIETPALKYFKLEDHSVYDHYCLIEKMPNLIEAYVDCYFPCISSFIGSITSVKHLTICSKYMLGEGVVFNQLEHLEVCLCKKDSSNQLVRLLKSSSNLQELEISYMGRHTIEGYDWNQPSTVPECLLSSLQSLSCRKYRGKPEELELVVYILKHALHLKTATIALTETGVTELEMSKELSLSPRASAACQLLFE